MLPEYAVILIINNKSEGELCGMLRVGRLLTEGAEQVDSQMADSASFSSTSLFSKS